MDTCHRVRGPNRRPARRFLPQAMAQLEEWALLSGGFSWAGAQHLTASAPSAGSSEIARWTERQNVSFPTVDGQFERLDVYVPNGPSSPDGRPVLIAIHGGGWRRLDKAGYGRRIASAFVPAGYVVVAPNYQLSAPGAPSWPENLEDVQAAVRWVRVNSGALGVDPNEIAAIGESAGANLAALVGTDSPKSDAMGVSAAVEAVVAFSTPADLTVLQAESPLAAAAAAQLLGGSPEQVPALYVAASPIDHVSRGDPPMFLVHGLDDPLIPVSQSQQMAAALAAAGVQSRLVLVNGGHDLDFPAHYSKLIPQILEFLDTTWKD
jgi:acetyl esterase/lipase